MPKKLTTEEFIKRAREVHGDRYDYSKVEYIGAKTKVEIICPIHGSFWQIPFSHLQGFGCSKCAGKSKLTTEEFIAKARKIHGDKYDYSNVEYSNSNTKIEIICPEHGSFWQTPFSHLQGHGCPKCANLLNANKRALTEIDFIEMAKDVHANKYDYSVVKYINNHTKVEIICTEHGSFCQTPASHLQGHGCPKCEGKYKQTTEEFIQSAMEIHGDKYNYDKVRYKNRHTKVEIICPEHGSFFQTPNSHLNGCGCPKCSATFKNTTDDFIQKARKTHGDKYSYSKVEYINSSTKVEIVCSTHGSFFQVPAMHLFGQGCPRCAKQGNSSNEENNLSSLLKNSFNIIKRNYNKDKRYPFLCDFYIPSEDLFIEYNGWWMHGREWYDGRKTISRNRIKEWSKKDSPQYKNSIETYAVKDVFKRQTARQNKLNYVVLWDTKDIDKWFELGCPDGHDYDYEYSWIKDDKERKEWIKTKKK